MISPAENLVSALVTALRGALECSVEYASPAPIGIDTPEGVRVAETADIVAAARNLAQDRELSVGITIVARSADNGAARQRLAMLRAVVHRVVMTDEDFRKLRGAVRDDGVEWARSETPGVEACTITYTLKYTCATADLT